MSMTEEEYENRARRIAENIQDARKARDAAQNLLEEIVFEETVLHINWEAQQRSGTGYPYKPGDIVHFSKATLPANRTCDYKVTKVTPDKLYVEAGGRDHSFTHEGAEKVGVFVADGEGLND